MSRAPPTIHLITTLERVKVPSAVVDRSGIVAWQNRAARETIGDLVGQPFASIVAPEYKEVAQRQLERLLLGMPVADYNLELFTADGRRRRAEISSVTIEGGDPYQAVFGIAVVGPPRPASAVHLTKRQNEVLELLAEGASTDQIAATLHLSKETGPKLRAAGSSRAGRALAARSGRARASRGLAGRRGLAARPCRRAFAACACVGVSLEQGLWRL